jgi:hypothetical protein
MFGPSHCFQRSQFCVEFYPRASPITIAGDRTARWARQFHAAERGPSLGKRAERSSWSLCLAGYTTFTALLHDEFLRPTGLPPVQRRAPPGVSGLALAAGYAFRDVPAKRRAVRWLPDHSLIDDEAADRRSSRSRPAMSLADAPGTPGFADNRTFSRPSLKVPPVEAARACGCARSQGNVATSHEATVRSPLNRAA